MQAVGNAGNDKPLVANIDVGLEPLAYCLLSPDARHVLSCDDDGQLELWSVANCGWPLTFVCTRGFVPACLRG